MFKSILKTSLNTSWWIIKIVLPVSLVVSLLRYVGMIDYIAQISAPAFQLIGLPGEAAIVYITSLFLPLYAALGAMAALPLSLHDATILSLMCLFAHSLPIEASVQQKCGLKAYESVPLRIIVSLLGAVILNVFLPVEWHALTPSLSSAAAVSTTLLGVLRSWVLSTGRLFVKLIVIITCLVALRAMLRHYGVWDKLTRPLAPFMIFCGLKEKSAFVWLVAQVVGITYGAGVMEMEIKESGADVEELKRVNRHIALNHSLLEDTILFASIGINVFWIVIPRLVFALIAVWGRIVIDSLLMRKKNI